MVLKVFERNAKREGRDWTGEQTRPTASFVGPVDVFFYICFFKTTFVFCLFFFIHIFYIHLDIGLVSRSDQLCKLCRPSACLVWPKNCLICLGTEFQKGFFFRTKCQWICKYQWSALSELLSKYCLFGTFLRGPNIILTSIIFCPRGFTVLSLQMPDRV